MADEVFTIRMHRTWRLSMKAWTAAAVVAAVATATLVVLIMNRSASAGPRQTTRYTDYLGGSSTNSTQCTQPPADRQGGWTCFTGAAP